MLVVALIVLCLHPALAVRSEVFLHSRVKEHDRAPVNSSAADDPDALWLHLWRQQLPLAAARITRGLARAWYETANRVGAVASEEETFVALETLQAQNMTVARPELERRSAIIKSNQVAATARGFRALVNNLVTPSEAELFRNMLNNRRDLTVIESGGQVSIKTTDFPPGTLERIRQGVMAVMAQHAEKGMASNVSSPAPRHVVFSSSNMHHMRRASRGPMQFLSAQVVQRRDGGLIGGHVDSSKFSSRANCRIPIPLNSMSAYTTDIFLSDPNSYGDGEIVFTHPPEQALKRALGDALHFASDVSNPHKVYPVRGGVRYALVIWWHDEPALAPAAGAPTPDTSVGHSPALEAASQALQRVSHLTHTEDADEWRKFLQVAAHVPAWSDSH